MQKTAFRTEGAYSYVESEKNRLNDANTSLFCGELVWMQKTAFRTEGVYTYVESEKNRLNDVKTSLFCAKIIAADYSFEKPKLFTSPSNFFPALHCGHSWLGKLEYPSRSIALKTERTG